MGSSRAFTRPLNEFGVLVDDRLHQAVYFWPPLLMIEHSDNWWRGTRGQIGKTQATTQDLCDQEFRVKGPLLVRVDLKDVLDVPTFAKHRYGDDPLSGVVSPVNSL